MSTQFPIAPVAIRKALEPPAGRALLDALLNPAVDLLERRHCICDIETEWRISPSGTGRTIREYESIIRRASFRQFAEWFRAGEGVSLAADHPFADLPQYADDEVSLYADYKHFNELFENHSSDSTSGSYIGYDASKRVFLGVKDRKQDIITWADILKKGNIDEFVPLDAIPTLWLSSQKAHSPLHYDTYGKNIVVQLVGRKRWLLWPAGSPSLAPLRIPYEESSVYSEFDPMEFISGYKTFEEGADALRAAHPGLVEVVLEEGDALLVPPHVWHFVETVSFCFLFKLLSNILSFFFCGFLHFIVLSTCPFGESLDIERSRGHQGTCERSSYAICVRGYEIKPRSMWIRYFRCIFWLGESI